MSMGAAPALSLSPLLFLPATCSSIILPLVLQIEVARNGSDVFGQDGQKLVPEKLTR